MSTLGSGATGAYVAAGVVAVGVAVGGYVYVTSKQETPVAPVATTTVEPEVIVITPTPEAASEVETAPVSVDPAPEVIVDPEPKEPAVATVVPPTFDVVRIDVDGNAVIAGLAAPLSEVFIYLDQSEIAQTPADNSGNFVALATIQASDAPQTVSLVMRADGVDTPSEATVIVAARPVPVPVAAVAETPVAPVVTPVEVEQTTVAETAIADAAPVVADAAPVVVSDDPVPAAVEVTPTNTTPVQEPAPVASPTILLADADGVRVLQGAKTATPTDVIIDAISYGEDGNAILSGRGTSDAVARAYLNNAIAGETTVAASGDWSMVLYDVAAGIYTLRIDQIDAAGTVTSRYETPFKREDPVVIAAAATPAPAPVSIKEPVVQEQVVSIPVTQPPETSAPVTAEPTPEPTQVAVTPTSSPAAPAPRVTAITVQPGFTLWKIAKDAYGQGDLYVQVFAANQGAIIDADLIYPGQVFEVPDLNAQ